MNLSGDWSVDATRGKTAARALRSRWTVRRVTARPMASSSSLRRAEFSRGWRGNRRSRSVAVLRMRNGTSQSPFRLALGDNPCAPVRPAPGHGYVTTCPQGGGRTSPWPYVEWLDGVSDALASGLCGCGTSPLHHAGQTPAPTPTPTGDYRPSLRSPWPAAQGPLAQQGFVGGFREGGRVSGTGGKGS